MTRRGPTRCSRRCPTSGRSSHVGRVHRRRAISSTPRRRRQREALAGRASCPVVAELSQGQPWDIDETHCIEFAEIFDADKNGYIDRNEFFRFVQFLVVMSRTSRGPAAEERRHLHEIAETMRIDDVIANVRDDAAWADKILPTLPDEWKDYLTSDEFIESAMDKPTASTPGRRPALAGRARRARRRRAVAGATVGHRREPLHGIRRHLRRRQERLHRSPGVLPFRGNPRRHVIHVE